MDPFQRSYGASLDADSGPRQGVTMQEQEGEGDQPDRDGSDRREKTLSDYDEQRRSRRPTVLLGFSGQQSWKLSLPERGRIVLGRGEGCDLVVKDARVSRSHCCLHVSTHVFLEDLASTTGTRLMGRALRRGEKRFLKKGDVFELGDTSVLCQVSAPASSQAEAPGTPPDVARDAQKYVEFGATLPLPSFNLRLGYHFG
jgi:hypothetical protein